MFRREIKASPKSAETNKSKYPRLIDSRERYALASDMHDLGQSDRGKEINEL